MYISISASNIKPSIRFFSFNCIARNKIMWLRTRTEFLPCFLCVLLDPENCIYAQKCFRHNIFRLNWCLLKVIYKKRAANSSLPRWFSIRCWRLEEEFYWLEIKCYCNHHRSNVACSNVLRMIFCKFRITSYNYSRLLTLKSTNYL